MGPRILIGTGELAKTVYNLTKGLREAGYRADSMVMPNRRHPFYQDADYTINDLDFLEGTTCSANESGGVDISFGRKFYALVDRYDIFIFIAGTSFLPRMVDVPLLKKMGKTLISRQCGTEVRDAEMAKVFWEAHDRFYPFYARDKETPKRKCLIERDVLRQGRYEPALANKLHNVRMAERYADAIFSGPPSQTTAIRPYFQSGPIFDAREFICDIPMRRTPVILHSPSNTLYKQTDIILQALDELKKEGVKYHLELLHDVPHEQVREKLTGADILLDEVSCGSGVLAYEAMASGCAVISGHNGVESPMPRNRPVYNITKDTIKDGVRDVIENMSLRRSLAEMGREFIDSGVGSPASVAEYMMNSLNRSGMYDADIYPTLFSHRAFIPEGECVPEYLNRFALEIMQTHGVDADADLQRLVNEGLLPYVGPEIFDSVPRWDMSKLCQEGPWITTGPKAVYGLPDRVKHQMLRGGTDRRLVSLA